VTARITVRIGGKRLVECNPDVMDINTPSPLGVSQLSGSVLFRVSSWITLRDGVSVFVVSRSSGYLFGSSTGSAKCVAFVREAGGWGVVCVACVSGTVRRECVAFIRGACWVVVWRVAFVREACWVVLCGDDVRAGNWWPVPFV